MIKIKVIHTETGESWEYTMTLESVLQGRGLIGRNPKCDLVLSSPEVSRVHGRISHQSGQYYYTDLGSTDGSLLNGQTIETNQDTLLRPDDIIRVGEFILLVKGIEIDQVEIDRLYKSDLSISGQDFSDVAQASITSQEAIEQPEASAVRLDPLIVLADDLRSQGILGQSSLEIVFQGKQLTQSLSLSKHLRERAIALHQAELEAGNFCLLVEYSDYFTLWLEKQSEPKIK